MGGLLSCLSAEYYIIMSSRARQKMGESKDEGAAGGRDGQRLLPEVLLGGRCHDRDGVHFVYFGLDRPRVG